MNSYLNKHAFTGPIIKSAPVQNLGIFVVVPVFKETNLKPVFDSLNNQKPPKCHVEVLFVFNASEQATLEVRSINEASQKELNGLIASVNNKSVSFFTCTFNNLPKKHAGVGLARKIGMDESVRRFELLGENGIIVNTDADCFVAENYLFEIEQHFENTATNGCSIYFEHPLENDDLAINSAIVQYELYLRYYINMQRLMGYPWAYQTIGSAMAVRSKVYQEQGGMNKRKAGEDFYFLQKIIELGKFSELNTTTVFASARKSDRVPFGTGKAVNDIIESQQPYGFYNPKSFEQLSTFFKGIEAFYQKSELEIKAIIRALPMEISTYLIAYNWGPEIAVINKLTSDFSAFKKRFFRKFNAFQLIKCLHWLRDEHFENVNAAQAIQHLLKEIKVPYTNNQVENLKALRAFDRNYQN